MLIIMICTSTYTFVISVLVTDYWYEKDIRHVLVIRKPIQTVLLTCKFHVSDKIWLVFSVKSSVSRIEFKLLYYFSLRYDKSDILSLTDRLCVLFSLNAHSLEVNIPFTSYIKKWVLNFVHFRIIVLLYLHTVIVSLHTSI